MKGWNVGGVGVSALRSGAALSGPGLGEPPAPPQAGPSPMAAIARARRAPAGGGQGYSDAPRWRTISAGPSVFLPPSGNLSTVDTELEKTGRAPFSHSRFLKVHNENGRGRQWCQVSGSAEQTASGYVAKSTPGSTSHTRSSSALRRVAQLENKIRNRRKQIELQNADLGQKPLDEESLSSASSREHGTRGKKYLKNYTTAGGNTALSDACSKEEESIQSPKKNVMVKQQLGLDSDEEEMRELMGCSLEFSSGNENQKIVVSDSKWSGKSRAPVSSGMPPPSHKEILPTEVSKASSFHSKDSEKNVFGRGNSPSPASRDLSALHNVRSQSLPSMKDDTVKITLPRTGNTKQSQISLASDRSEIKSLDDLFSEAADAEDSTSSSSNDFRLNILSLDDLAPNIINEVAELKQKRIDLEITQESSRNPKNDTFLVEKDQTSLKMTSAVTGVNDASDGNIEKTVTEAEISEHLSGVSAGVPRQARDDLDHDERTVNSEYSEDFERSLSTTDREPVSKMSEGHSESCTYSGKHPSPASLPSLTRAQRDRGHRVTVRETAVQTVDPPFTYCWSKMNASAVLDPPVGHSYVDPVPVASHTISMDAVEALTAYSPSVLVLNAMLKQHLMLTQQFIENIHHLHLSLVESLESEKFHYHTLEEAKEYIKNHKSPPLTLEQAREEIWKAQKENQL